MQLQSYGSNHRVKTEGGGNTYISKFNGDEYDEEELNQDI